MFLTDATSGQGIFFRAEVGNSDKVFLGDISLKQGLGLRVVVKDS